MTVTGRRAPLVTVLLCAAAIVAACGSTAGTASSAAGAAKPSAATGAPVAVVTSTNVWGDVVAQVGGDSVAVTPVIVDPAADPHSFEPTAQAQLAVAKADLIVKNGGGYDDWMSTMIAGSNTSAPVIDAVQVSGKDTGPSGVSASGSTPGSAPPPLTSATQGTAAGGQGGSELNEHVWYDLPTVDLVAHRIADELGSLRPDRAPYFQSNLATFTDKIHGLTAKVDAIKATHGGTGIAVTEPVPLYLTDAAGLVNKTPAEFSKAIEEGTDVPPTVLNDTLALFTGHQVTALIYNEQTSSPETEQLQAAAKDNNIAVVPVTETLPAGNDYLSWMDANITAIAAAVTR
jgi:zinc/manganese transport system substrate-binding protein